MYGEGFAIGLVSQTLVRPLDSKWFMSSEKVAALQEKRQSAVFSRTIGRRGWTLQTAVVFHCLFQSLGRHERLVGECLFDHAKERPDLGANEAAGTLERPYLDRRAG